MFYQMNTCINILVDLVADRSSYVIRYLYHSVNAYIIQAVYPIHVYDVFKHTAIYFRDFHWTFLPCIMTILLYIYISCSRWRIIRASQRWPRGPTSYCTRTTCTPVPHNWPSGPCEVSSPTICRRLPLIPLYQICAGPYPTFKTTSMKRATKWGMRFNANKCYVMSINQKSTRQSNPQTSRRKPIPRRNSFTRSHI